MTDSEPASDRVDEGARIRQLELQLRAAERRSEQLEEAYRRRGEGLGQHKSATLGTLVAGMGHEISNPNHFIMLNLPILRDAWADAEPVLDRFFAEHPEFRLSGLSYAEMREEVPQLIEEILRGCERIKRIVSGLREYANSGVGQDVCPVDVNAVVQATADRMQSRIAQATDHFTIDFAQALPRVLGCAQRLEDVVSALLTNACEALADRESGASVRTTYDADSQSVIVQVDDDGRGISPENLPRITDPFFTTKRQEGGIGLGLAVAANVVAEHGGRLDHESEVGRGTRARVALPATS